jgi:NADPH:quinone reductase-like Zn-dependent oxidoreductase
LIIQLANHFRFKTINIIRREEWRKELMNLGADEVINSRTEGITDFFAAV